MSTHTLAGAAGIRKTLRHLGTLLGVASLLSGCNGRGPISGVPGPTPTAYSLSGVVSESSAVGTAPIEGAQVTEMVSGRAVVSDVNGAYTITGLSAMNRSVRVAKDGYATGTVTITMTGDTQLDIRLERAGPYVLSGVVYEITEAGPLPLEGVQLYCDSCGSPGGHTFVGTDADGAYRFEWTYDGFHPLLVRKMGYRIIDSTGRLLDDWITASVRGDTRFDIQLVRR